MEFLSNKSEKLSSAAIFQSALRSFQWSLSDLPFLWVVVASSAHSVFASRQTNFSPQLSRSRTKVLSSALRISRDAKVFCDDNCNNLAAVCLCRYRKDYECRPELEAILLAVKYFNHETFRSIFTFNVYSFIILFRIQTKRICKKF